jgi:glutathione synthase/RimK-type ligase-like ATP-grasp enzyme
VVAQRFVEHAVDGYPSEYRVLTLFGRALYCARNRWREKRRPLSEIAATDGVIASNDRSFGGRQREAVRNVEVIALAERAASAFPDCALLGVDIIREAGTEDLYVLEVNPNGRTWHFSSELSQSFEERHRRDLYEQFGGMRRAADILIGATRRLAR